MVNKRIGAQLALFGVSHNPKLLLRREPLIACKDCGGGGRYCGGNDKTEDRVF